VNILDYQPYKPDEVKLEVKEEVLDAPSVAVIPSHSGNGSPSNLTPGDKDASDPLDLSIIPVSQASHVQSDTAVFDQKTKMTLLKAIDEHKDKVLCKSYTIPAR